MMNASKRKRLALITLVYWFLLLYIISALIFWYISLYKQNDAINGLRKAAIEKNDPLYQQKIVKIEGDRKRKEAQYIGEGSTFLVLILIGAVFVYRATRRQIRLAQQQENFMMAVTHELKTPIAVTQLNLETLLRRQLDEETREKLIRNTLQEAVRLNQLSNNILLASQLEGGNYTSLDQEVNLSEIVMEVIREYSARYPLRHITSLVEPEVFIHGESLLLKMLLNNLVENALKYSPKEKQVRIELQQSAKETELKVIDEGIGIPPEEKKQVFNKFYRVGNENTRKAHGTGLGLYLSKRIAKAHKGSIAVKDNQPQGSIFTIIFNNRNEREQ
jgi:two-component system, OmpR family, sensor histidine kinase CiaH